MGEFIVRSLGVGMLASMSRRILPLLPLLLLVLTAPVTARTLQARIDKVTTAVATLEDVGVRLDWPAQATQGELVLTARSVDAPDLGYRYRDLRWRCPLQRDGQGGWRCDGELRSGRGRPLRLSLALGVASTDAALTQGKARFALHRQAATPDLTTLELTRVPVAWSQALLARAWQDAQLTRGTLDGRFNVHAPAKAPLRVEGKLAVAGLGLETPDGGIAAENIGGRFDIDYRNTPQLATVALDGQLRGGELLAGNAYIELPPTPVDLQIQGRQRKGEGWQLPRIVWRDGDKLVAEGSAAFTVDASLRMLDLHLRSADLAPLRERYLSGWLGLFGLADLQLSGAFDVSVRVADGRLQNARANLHGIDLIDPQGRFRFDGLSGTPRFSASAPVSGELRWRGGQLYGLDFGAATLPIDSHDGVLQLRDPVTVPMLGGGLRFDRMTLRPRSGEAGAEIGFGLSLDQLDIGKLSQALGWPAFRGTLSGRIPNARYANERLDFDGGLSMRLFDGSVAVSSLSMDRPFGVAPSLSADVVIDDLDLLALTEVFGFGSITGRLDGRIDDLRLVDWTATAFDAELHTDRKPGVRQRISQRAVQNISSVGDASFVTSLQGRLIGLFDDFGYKRIGIGCRLANEVCEMRGLGADRPGSKPPGSDNSSPDNAGSDNAGSEPGFIIVAGSGLPKLTVVGFNRRVDWPTLVERLAAVSKGDIKPVVE